MGTIALRGATAITAATDTATPFANLSYTLPSGHALNDLLIAFYGGKPYNTVPSTPTDYTAWSGGANGTTAMGAGTGSMYAIAFTKVRGASESNPASTFSAQYSPGITAMIGLYSQSGTGAWTVQSCKGSDATATGTDFSATGDATLPYKVGDWVVVQLVHNDDSSASSSFGITVPGCTVGTVSQRLTGTPTTATGNDGRMYVVTAEITAGAASGAPVVTATTGSGDADGQAVFLLVRDSEYVEDAVGLTDAPLMTQVILLEESIGVTDAVTIPMLRIEEEVMLRDGLNVAIGVTQAETGLGVTDTATRSMTRAVSDSVGVTDAGLTSANLYSRTADDALGLSDPAPDVVKEGPAAIVVDDNAGLSDECIPVVDQGESVAATDLLNVTDSLDIRARSSETENGVGITDARAVQHDVPLIVVTATDAIGVSDSSLTVTKDGAMIVRTVDDSSGLIDSLHISIDTSLAHGAIGVTDADAYQIFDEAVVDDVGVDDELMPAKWVNINDSVSVTGDPAVDVAAGTSYSIQLNTEAIAVTDSIAVLYLPQTDYTRTVTDTVAIDDLNLDTDGPFVQRALNEQVGLSDSLTLTTSLAISDPVDVTDPASPLKAVSLTEAVGVTDAVTMLSPGRIDAINVEDTISVTHVREGLDGRTQRDDLVLEDEITVTMARVVTVSDFLDVIDRQTLAGNLRLTVADIVGASELISTAGWSLLWRLTTPWVMEAPAGGQRPFGRYRLRRGISLLITGSQVVESRYPSLEELEAADTYYLGGHEQLIPYADGLLLAAAGYGDYLELSQERVTT